MKTRQAINAILLPNDTETAWASASTTSLQEDQMKEWLTCNQCGTSIPSWRAEDHIQWHDHIRDPKSFGPAELESCPCHPEIEDEA